MLSSGKLPSREAAVLRGHEGAALTVRWNSDGKYCLSGGKDRSLRLWNPYKQLLIKKYEGHGREIRDVAASRDNSKLCSCGGDRQLFYWDVSTGRIIRKFRGHDSEVNSVKFHELATCIVSGGNDKMVQVWDCRSNSIDPIQKIDEFSDSVMSVVITPNEILAGAVDGTVHTFDIRGGRQIVDDLGHSVTSVSLSNDGNCTLAGCLDSTLRLLDRETGDELQQYRGHTNQSYKMDSCLTSSDAHIVSGSEDGRIYFWDLVDPSKVTSFKTHASVVTGVSYHPTDNCMLTSSTDMTIRLWKT
ncbi:unnamed protein product [Calypogeia fissa]